MRHLTTIDVKWCQLTLIDLTFQSWRFGPDVSVLTFYVDFRRFRRFLTIHVVFWRFSSFQKFWNKFWRFLSKNDNNLLWRQFFRRRSTSNCVNWRQMASNDVKWRHITEICVNFLIITKNLFQIIKLIEKVICSSSYN